LCFVPVIWVFYELLSPARKLSVSLCVFVRRFIACSALGAPGVMLAVVWQQVSGYAEPCCSAHAPANPHVTLTRASATEDLGQSGLEPPASNQATGSHLLVRW
jgi:hypothetical protein